jgi:hypothetical protein
MGLVLRGARPAKLPPSRHRQEMFQDLNVLYDVKTALRDDPDYDRADTARWEDCLNWPEAKYDAAVEATHAYMFSRLNHRPRSSDRAQSASKRWHARLAEHRQLEQQEQEQHAGAATKKQKK